MPDKVNWTELIFAGRQDPVWFAEEVLGEKLWDGQKQIIHAVFNNDKTSVRSCHASGKSYVSAVIVHMWLMFFPDSVVVTTSASHDQLKNALWRGIAERYEKYKLIPGIQYEGKITEKGFELGKKWYAIGINPKEPDRLQGYHANDILLIVDEASGLNEEVFKRRGTILTGANAHELLLGNPTRPSGSFYKAFSTPPASQGGYHKMHIDAHDIPNFTDPDHGIEEWEALASPKTKQQVIQEFGEDSPEYQIRVLGNFPEQGVDSVFNSRWIDEAMKREMVRLDTHRLLSVDPARFGSDTSAIVGFVDGNVHEVFGYVGKDSAFLIGEIMRIAAAGRYTDIIMDCTGIGGPIHDVLKRTHGLRMHSFEGGSSAQDKRYYNLIAQIWFEGADAFKRGEIAIGPNRYCDRIRSDMIGRQYRYMGDKLALEKKDDMKKRGANSPDFADAMCMGIYLRTILRRRDAVRRNRPTGRSGPANGIY